MKDKKLQVFVSSTFLDLKEERQAAVEAILSAGHIPAGMELFTAGDESQMTVIKRWIDESDVYLLLLGGRYGSLEGSTGKSYTHLEYEYAIQTGKPLFAIVISDQALESKVREGGTAVLETENGKLLKSFRSLVLSNLVKFWQDKKDIKLAVYETLSEFAYKKEMVGWVRGNSVDSSILVEEIARLTKENNELKKQLSSVGKFSQMMEPLYSGLTFNEMYEFLNNEIVILADLEVTLLQFLVSIGDKLVSSITVGIKTNRAYERLEFYNIVKIITPTFLTRDVSFTQDGHNFYLKLKLLRDKEDRSAKNSEL